MHPLDRLALDRRQATALGDPMANVVVLSTVDHRGSPQSRALVLRDMERGLAIFCNSSSSKVEEFSNSSRVSALLYLPAVRVQYRLSCELEAVPAEIVRSRWHQRPDFAKRLDAIYELAPQSSEVESQLWLADRVAQSDTPAVAPESVIGFYLVPLEIDRLELAGEDRLHDRRRYRKSGHDWIETNLVP